MFVCNDCLGKYFENEPSFSRSRGKCECCEEVADCNDIPSGALYPKKPQESSQPKQQ